MDMKPSAKFGKMAMEKKPKASGNMAGYMKKEAPAAGMVSKIGARKAALKKMAK